MQSKLFVLICQHLLLTSTFEKLSKSLGSTAFFFWNTLQNFQVPFIFVAETIAI